LDKKPTRRHVCQSGPCPNRAPTPDLDPSQMTHMGSKLLASIGLSIGDLQASVLMDSKHLCSRGIHTNGQLFLAHSDSGEVYAVMSGMNWARYCTSPRKHWISW